MYAILIVDFIIIIRNVEITKSTMLRKMKQWHPYNSKYLLIRMLCLLILDKKRKGLLYWIKNNTLAVGAYILSHPVLYGSIRPRMSLSPLEQPQKKLCNFNIFRLKHTAKIVYFRTIWLGPLKLLLFHTLFWGFLKNVKNHANLA